MLEYAGLFLGGLGTIGWGIETIEDITILFNAHSIQKALKKEGTHTTESEIQILATIAIIYHIILLVANICLLLGTIKKRHNLILPWLIVFVLKFLTLIFSLGGADTYSTLFKIVGLICVWIVVFLLYTKIKKENQTASTPNSPSYVVPQFV